MTKVVSDIQGSLKHVKLENYLDYTQSKKMTIKHTGLVD